jgi:hypothetical protein
MTNVISFQDYAEQRRGAKQRHDVKQRDAASPSVIANASNQKTASLLRVAAEKTNTAMDVLNAAKPLLRHCRDQFGFTVMRGSIPSDPGVLTSCVLALTQALALLESEIGPCRSKKNFGVYFGRDELSWFEDGYGGNTGLAVPNDIDAKSLAEFVRPHVVAIR